MSLSVSAAARRRKLPAMPDDELRKWLSVADTPGGVHISAIALDRIVIAALKARERLDRLEHAVQDVICGRGMTGISDKADLEWAVTRLADAIGGLPDESA
jgi:hypothetical protein